MESCANIRRGSRVQIVEKIFKSTTVNATQSNYEGGQSQIKGVRDTKYPKININIINNMPIKSI